MSVSGTSSRLPVLASQGLPKMFGARTGLSSDPVCVCPKSGKASGALSVNSDDDSRGWSTASGSDQSAGGVELPVVDSPVRMISGLRAEGLTVEQAVEMVKGYFECYKKFVDVTAVASPPPTEVVSLPSRSARRRARREAYKKTLESMARDDGMCYLRVVKLHRRMRISQELGARPTLHGFLTSLREGDLDADAMQRHRVVCVSDKPGAFVYHLTETVGEGDVDVGSFRNVVAAIVASLPSCLKYKCDFTADKVVSMIPIVATIGSRRIVVTPTPVVPMIGLERVDVMAARGLTVFASNDLTALARSDFSSCKCKVHVKFPFETLSAGCGARQVGSHPVVQAAAEGKHVYCHAEQLVRDADKNFLQFALSGSEERAYAAERVPVSVERYCSVVGASARDFGKGYCYLTPIRPKARWRVARLLGPCPLLRDVAVMLRVVGANKFRPLVLEPVVGGLYHVANGQVKGESSEAGSKFYDEVVRVIGTWPDARVGVRLSELCFDWWNVRLKSGTASDMRLCGKCGIMVKPEGHEGSCRGSQFSDMCRQETVVVDACDDMLIPRPVSKDRGRCDTCGFIVKLDGHEERCKKPVMPSGDKLLLSRRAWLGDVQHRLDVRVYVLLSGVPDKARGQVEERFVERGAQAAWYKAYQGDKEAAGGTSEHSLSTAFEASYVGIFRAAYVADQLMLREDVVVDGDLMRFVTGLPIAHRK